MPRHPESPAKGPAATYRPTDTRLHHIDGLRALAALWVVVHHVWLTIYSIPDDQPPRGIIGTLTDWMLYGHFAVVAFIVLSGYSLAISTSRNGGTLPGGAWLFLKRRFRRIVLPYWGALAISLVLATTVLRHKTGTHWDVAIPVTARGVVDHTLLLHDFADTGQINHVFWSIAIEWHIYFLFPVLVLLNRKLGLVPTTVVLVGICAVLDRHWVSKGLTLQGEVNLIGCFALGVAAAQIAHNRQRLPLRGEATVTLPWGWITASLTVATATLIYHYGFPDAALSHNATVEPAVGASMAALLIHLAARPDGPLRAVLSAAPLVWIGAFSFSLYLLHALVIQLVWQYVMKPAGMPLHDGVALGVLLPLSLIASIAVAWAYFQLVEKRCMPSRMRHAVEVELRTAAGRAT